MSMDKHPAADESVNYSEVCCMPLEQIDSNSKNLTDYIML